MILTMRIDVRHRLKQNDRHATSAVMLAMRFPLFFQHFTPSKETRNKEILEH